MGNRLSKEHAAVPFAYARDPTTDSHSSQAFDENHNLTSLNNPSSTASDGADFGSTLNQNNLYSSPGGDNLAVSSVYNTGLDPVTNELTLSRSAVINNNPIHKLELVPEIDRDQDFLDSLPLIIPLLAEYMGFETRYAEEKLASDPSVEILTFGQLPSLTTIGACSQNLISVSRHIGLLIHTTTLQLCCNRLTSIPAEIGYLKNLVVLSIAHNNLTTLPDTIGLLPKLVQLKANNNQLTCIPEAIYKLSKLEVLQLESNQITSLSNRIGTLTNLVTIDLSNNPIEVLPAELGRLKMLRRIGTSNCPLFTLGRTGDAVLPSLKELAARIIVRFQLPILSITQPELKDYLASANECSFCAGPYFETYTTHVRLVERSRASLPLQYRLCTKHWSNDADRIRVLFAPLPPTAPNPIPTSFCPPLPTPPDSPDNRLRKTSASALPLSSLTKSPSLPLLPIPSDGHSRKSSASKLFRKTALLASGMRVSRSLSFLSLQNTARASSGPP
ncbi:hypothetical protein BASA50_009541 [Batrachochytrium salamandrivorans]|uniref:Disease resistance R13L4/SHOC-2-like LRR domain-containing protein n=1 Tax=Batrachochytrium salamandrivorans TaxID=1357716 RepID=A0ABQ8F1A3_9FUNG|nr:hypothetical protein BASA62_009742 [Batrachochytrium salamandrivorans]KAH6561834.1 hypothetical protein BASA60_011338 [Batrachochytrium salamandrivorans]KAH6586749.1 hypothetical protein BASA61_006460 [Batrachochytrium salamandrivorans]KAH6590281.1 hypothetical protein BASA50_009541 [Batrachochytrium salamandrivorans]